MARTRRPRRSGSYEIWQRDLERARELLAVLEAAHAANQARHDALGDADSWEDGWEHTTRGALLPAIRGQLDGWAELPDAELLELLDTAPGHIAPARLAAVVEEWSLGMRPPGRPRPEWLRLLVITGTREGPEGPWPSAYARLSDVLAWLEAVVEGPSHRYQEVVLVLPDWGVMLAAGQLRVPEEADARAAVLEEPPPDDRGLGAPDGADDRGLGAPDGAPGLGRHARRVEPPPEQLAPGARQLPTFGPDTVALEQTLARAPLFAASAVRHGLQLELGLWRTTGSLYGQPFRVLEPRGPLTPRDALGLAHIIRAWADAGYPAERRVRVSEAEAVRWFGYSTTGGRQRELLREAMGRLRATTFQHASRSGPGGRSDTLTWGLLDWARTPRTGPEGEGRVLLTLSEPLAFLVTSGKLTYLDAPMYATILAADELAARLWLFLESEELGRIWRYPLFSSEEGRPALERDTPAVADLLRISSWAQRRDVARRVKRAAGVLVRHDSRYRLTLNRAPRGRGMWTLEALREAGTARRARRVLGDAVGVQRAALEGTAGRAEGVLPAAQSRSKQGGTVGSLPSVSYRRVSISKAPPKRRGDDLPSWDEDGVVLDAWLAIYPRRPTPRQLDVLAELVEHHDAAGIANALLAAPADVDALRHVLDRDRQDRAAIRAELRAWAAASRSRVAPMTEEPSVLEQEERAPPVVREEDTVEPTPEQRAEAVRFLREYGVEGHLAEKLRQRYRITEAELWPERTRTPEPERDAPPD